MEILGFEFHNITAYSGYIEMEQDVCMEKCFLEDADDFTRHVKLKVSMPLSDNIMKTYDGFHMYYQCYEDFYDLGYFYSLPQAIQYFKDNFAKIVRKIDAYGTTEIEIEGIKFEKVELPDIYTDDTININNLFDEEV